MTTREHDDGPRIVSVGNQTFGDFLIEHIGESEYGVGIELDNVTIDITIHDDE